MPLPLKALFVLTCCVLLAGCSSGRTDKGTHAPVNLRSGCNQSGEPVPFIRGGGDQFYYCASSG